MISRGPRGEPHACNGPATRAPRSPRSISGPILPSLRRLRRAGSNTARARVVRRVPGLLDAITNGRRRLSAWPTCNGSSWHRVVTPNIAKSSPRRRLGRSPRGGDGVPRDVRHANAVLMGYQHGTTTAQSAHAGGARPPTGGADRRRPSEDVFKVSRRVADGRHTACTPGLGVQRRVVTRTYTAVNGRTTRGGDR